MSELEKEYADRAKFTIVPPEETVAATEDIERFGFTDLKHGLVAFDAEGEALVKMPGHDFPKEDIVAALEKVLAAN